MAASEKYFQYQLIYRFSPQVIASSFSLLKKDYNRVFKYLLVSNQQSRTPQILNSLINDKEKQEM